jgi:ELWxxDGT repeat protein
VQDIAAAAPPPPFVESSAFADLGDELITAGYGGQWKLKRDGTSPEFVDALFGSPAGSPYLVYGDYAYLGGTRDDGVFSLWRTDGTAAGSGLVFSTPGRQPNEKITDSVVFQNELYFTTISWKERSLWRTDGTAAGTRRIADIGIPHIDYDVTINRPPSLTVVGETLLFNAYDDDHGWELWTSDGTAAGTHVFVEINKQRLLTFGDFDGNGKIDLADFGILKENFGKPASYGIDVDGDGWLGLGEFGLFKLYFGNPELQNNIRASAYPSELAVVGDAAYFFANDGLHGLELWRTDGTVAGTQMVVDLAPGEASSHAFHVNSDTGVIPRANDFVFYANDGSNGSRLWQSDGTAAGTRMLDATGEAENGEVAVWNDLLFYFQSGSLWRSDGTSAGTVRLADLSPGGPRTGGASFVVADDWVYVLGASPSGKNDLWRTDGTIAGTQLVNPTWSAAGSEAYQLLALADVLFLSVRNEEGGISLWRTSGAAEGTAPVFAE